MSKKAYIWFAAFIKRLLLKKRILFLMLAFPLLCLGISIYCHDEKPLLQVALYNQGGTHLAEQTITELEDMQDVIHFYRASNAEELYTDVANTTAECGYIFTKNYTLEHILDQAYWENSVQVVESPGSMLTGTMNELVFASFFRLYNKELLRDYLSQEGVLKKAKDIPLAQTDGDTIFDSHCADGSTFSFSFTEGSEGTDSATADDISKEAHAVTNTFLTDMCRGILSVLILLAALCGLLILHKDRTSSLFLPLPAGLQPVMEWLEVLAPASLVALSGWIGICLLPAHRNLIWESIGLLLYVLEASCGVCLFDRLVRHGSYIQATIPLLTLGALIFPPIFLDFSAYMKAMTVPKYLFINSYYLEMATGGGAALGRLLAVTLGLAAMLLLVNQLSPHNPNSSQK